MKSERLKGKTVKQAGAAGNMCEKTARKYLKSNKLPSEENRLRNYRTRKDIFESIEDEIFELLESNPGLEAKTIFEYLQKNHPGKFQTGQLRTLQRKIKNWRVIEGPEKEVFFAQVYKPGDQCQSDFTCMNSLGIMIDHKKFKHKLYHFVLPYSNWETGSICYSESFESLSEGLQKALWQLGGTPTEHRTDRLSAAINNQCNSKDFTYRYKSLLEHYKLKASKTNPYSGNENGDVEQSHFRFKKAIDQALMLRGSRNFETIEEYEIFLMQIMEQRNRNKSIRFQEELKKLQNLPETKLSSFKVLTARVSKFSTVRISHNVYSVPSRLIGENIKAYLYADKIKIYYGTSLVQEMKRLQGESNCLFDYRHVISSLVKKPGGFEKYQYRDFMFPNIYFKVAYENLEHLHSKQAKEYLQILMLAKDNGEDRVTNALQYLIDQSIPVTLEKVFSLLDEKKFEITHLTENFGINSLSDYDTLLSEVYS